MKDSGGDSSAPVREVRRVGPELATEALGILREAAAWAMDRGSRVWTDVELRDQDLPSLARLGQLVMGFSADLPVAVMLLQPSDPIYWPEAPPGSSLFLHKIAVRREFAGQGWLSRLIQFAQSEAEDHGTRWLRLDTLWGSPLQGLYERSGFAALDEAPFIIQGQWMIRMQRRL